MSAAQQLQRRSKDVDLHFLTSPLKGEDFVVVVVVRRATIPEKI